MDNYFESSGATTLHEVIESYIAGAMVQESGVSSGNSNSEGSVYEEAHAAASEIAPQSGVPFQDFRDSQGNTTINKIPAGGSGTIYLNDGKILKDILWTYP